MKNPVAGHCEHHGEVVMRRVRPDPLTMRYQGECPLCFSTVSSTRFMDSSEATEQLRDLAIRYGTARFEHGLGDDVNEAWADFLDELDCIRDALENLVLWEQKAENERHRVRGPARLDIHGGDGAA